MFTYECRPQNERFSRFHSIRYIVGGRRVSWFLRFEKRKGEGRSRVAPNLYRINLSRRSVFEPSKLNCSLSASIGHSRFCSLSKKKFFEETRRVDSMYRYFSKGNCFPHKRGKIFGERNLLTLRIQNIP